MRITQDQRSQIKSIVTQRLGGGAHVWLFGSRVDDNARGGDIDLFISCDVPLECSIQSAASISTQVTRLFRGRKTDVIIEAPNIKHLPIYDVAKATGVEL